MPKGSSFSIWVDDETTIRYDSSGLQPCAPEARLIHSIHSVNSDGRGSKVQLASRVDHISPPVKFIHEIWVNLSTHTYRKTDRPAWKIMHDWAGVCGIKANELDIRNGYKEGDGCVITVTEKKEFNKHRLQILFKFECNPPTYSGTSTSLNSNFFYLQKNLYASSIVKMTNPNHYKDPIFLNRLWYVSYSDTNHQKYFIRDTWWPLLFSQPINAKLADGWQGLRRSYFHLINLIPK